jgi:F-type H+-transporting ATPase subunit c
MRKVTFVLFIMAVLFFAAPAYAQGGTTATTGIGNWFMAGIGLGIAVGGAALAQGKIAASACEGMARNPAARQGIQLALVLGLAFVESLVLFIWVMIFLKA